jgi:hypothetical protein
MLQSATPQEPDRSVQQSAIDSQIPAKPFKMVSSEEKGGSKECGICLSTFQDDDSVRLLRCRHLFHDVCVDQVCLQRHLLLQKYLLFFGGCSG